MTSIDDLVLRVRRRRDLPPVEERQLIRVDAEVPRREVAEALSVSPVTVWRWEKGQREPHGELRERYAELLHALAALDPRRGQ